MLYNETTVILGLVHFLLPFMILNVYRQPSRVSTRRFGGCRAVRSAATQAGKAFWKSRCRCRCRGLPPVGCSVSCSSAGTYITPLVLGGPRDAMFANLVFEAVITQLNWPLGSALSLMLLAVLGTLVRLYNRYPRHGATDEGAWLMGWNLIRVSGALLVYLFMFLPVAVVVLLIVQCQPVRLSFPMTGFIGTLVRCAGRTTRRSCGLSALRFILGLMTAAHLHNAWRAGQPGAWCATGCRARNLISTLLDRANPGAGSGSWPWRCCCSSISLSVNKSFALLLVMGHVIFTLPFRRCSSFRRASSRIRRDYRGGGAEPWCEPGTRPSFEVTLPLMLAPAVLAGALFAFTISFDDITGTLFWKPGGVETVPTQIFAMLRNSISPEINALGTVMIVLTVGLPLLGMLRLPDGLARNSGGS